MLVTFRHPSDGALRAGIVHDRLAVPLGDSADNLNIDGHVGPSIKRLLAEGPATLTQRITQTLARVEADPASAFALSAVELVAPVPDPDKIVCLGLNYREHADEVELDRPTEPVLFAKYRNALAGAQMPIPVKRGQSLDYEGELAVVIGKTARDVRAQDAIGHIAGVMPLNDISDRELQFRSGQWLPGKASDGFAPCGPWIMTIDGVGDLQNLEITTRINDVVVQQANTSEMIFHVAETVAYISSILTLEPGDIISTGTPSGVGYTRRPPLFLKDGDVVDVEISGIGVLRNPVVDVTKLDRTASTSVAG